jgi:CheY-like chemotaxis protein
MAKILIIDDDPMMRMLIKIVMRPFKHEIIEAEDGALGISLAVSRIPDLIICDYHMPKINGLETLTSIRKEKALKNTPVIVASTGINKQSETAYKQLGVYCCFTKPVDIITLRDSIVGVLTKQTLCESTVS